MRSFKSWRVMIPRPNLSDHWARQIMSKYNYQAFWKLHWFNKWQNSFCCHMMVSIFQSSQPSNCFDKKSIYLVEFVSVQNGVAVIDLERGWAFVVAWALALLLYPRCLVRIYPVANHVGWANLQSFFCHLQSNKLHFM